RSDVVLKRLRELNKHDAAIATGSSAKVEDGFGTTARAREEVHHDPILAIEHILKESGENLVVLRIIEYLRPHQVSQVANRYLRLLVEVAPTDLNSKPALFAVTIVNLINIVDLTFDRSQVRLPARRLSVVFAEHD